ncbi:MAG: DUF951 domain-containing protein [Clostridia bacterium]|nr:DUF951 domain-containing protein [Clostridia bacterium]
MEIPRLRPGDLLELKKPHPCGTRQFRVVRVGSEVRIVCCACGRDLVLDRLKLERAIKKIIPAEENANTKERNDTP